MSPFEQLLAGLFLLLGWLFYQFVLGLVWLLKQGWFAINRLINTRSGITRPTQASSVDQEISRSIQLPQENTDTGYVSAPNIEFFKKESILTEAEKNFDFILEKIANEHNLSVNRKVRLEALVGVHFFLANWWGLRNRIKSREMDFVLCGKGSFSPLLIIELDDASHLRADRVERDENLNRILADAGLPILHVKVASFYDSQVLTREILGKITVTNKS